MTPIELGSVSSGTMRPEDLIPRFATLLEALAPEEALRLRAEFAGVFADIASRADTEKGDYLLDALFDALAECAPAGVYFGAHLGDDADYGFWKEWER